MSNRGGFTLIEMLLVVVVIASMAGVVAFTGGSSIRWRTLNHDATGIYSLCRYARAIAVEHSKRTRVEIDATARTYKLTIEDDPVTSPDTFASPEGSWSEVFRIDERVTVTLIARESGNEAVTYVTFQPDGTADGIDIELTHDEFAERIRVSVNELTGLSTLEVVDEE